MIVTGATSANTDIDASCRALGAIIGALDAGDFALPKDVFEEIRTTVVHAYLDALAHRLRVYDQELELGELA